jgi:hypothetical protein
VGDTVSLDTRYLAELLHAFSQQYLRWLPYLRRSIA